jgi:lipoyl-dependent peroxiredoxin
MVSKAQVVWRGGVAPGAPTPGKSTAFEEAAYSLTTLFESGKGRNPRELLAAAHAGCFTAALAFSLRVAGYTPTELSTQAVITQEPEGPGFRISCSALTLRATVPNLTRATFETMAWDAVNNCPISRVLRTQIWLDATLL